MRRGVAGIACAWQLDQRGLVWLAEQIRIHDPAVFLSLLMANCFNQARNFAELSRYKDLFLHSQISAPEDIELFIEQRVEGALSIQHHKGSFRNATRTGRELAACRDDY